MIIKRAAFFFLTIYFKIGLAMMISFEDGPLKEAQFFDATKRIINCNALKIYGDVISWDMEKISADVSFKPEMLPVIFKYSDLLVHSNGYYDRLNLSENRSLYLAGVDFSDLVSSEFYYNQDEEDDEEYITNSQRIVFDFSSNQIKEISWNDLCAIYSYFVGLANNYSSFFRVTKEGFIFRNNPLSIKARVKLYLLCIVLRLRLLFHGSSFTQYQYITW